MKLRAALSVGLTMILAVGLMQFATPPQKAEAAAVANQFNPGMIISDALFYDGGAMTANAVQNFLNSQVRGCAAGYTCLKDYRQDTASRPAVAGRCAAYAGAANESSAEIIAKVGAACGISQKALIVLLQKEQGLVTATSPTSGKYQIATGFACPDTAACDAQYFGFFNQVYSAASQFKRYSTLPSAFNHVAGRVNNIRLHPNAACGSTPVLIQNAATAGLYNYTPYQPNASAMANLYGTGDACASYGNRNFWRYYTDWFGSTTVSSLLRTPESDAVYLVVGTKKHQVPTFDLYNAFAPLGAASYVSQAYLDTLTTSHPATRVIRTSDTSIYFIDSAIKVPFPSCEMVVDYGGSCNSDGYVDVTDAQAAAFYTGPYATSVFGTTAGTRYLLDNGTKHEILNDSSQAAAGIPFGMIVLTETAIAHLPFASPVINDSSYVHNRDTGGATFVAGGIQYPVQAPDVAAYGVPPRYAGALRAGSLGIVPIHSYFSGVVTVPGSGSVQVLSASGRFTITNPAMIAAVSPIAVSAGFVGLYTDQGTLADGAYVKSPTDSSVYVLSAASLRPIAGWDSLVSLANTPNPTILTVPANMIAALPKGPPVLGPGTMYRTFADTSIYLIDGLGNRVPIGSFDHTDAAGFTKWTYASQENLNGYPIAPAALTFGVVCNGTKYVSAGGSLHALTATTEALYPFAFTPLAATTCARTVVGTPAIDFIRTSNGSIYQLVAGERRGVTAAGLAALNAGRGWLQVTDRFAADIPLGPPAG